MQNKIICLVGESGSGKTTIAELLEKEGFNHIQSYTTRLQRHEGEKGHVFKTRAEIIKECGLSYNPMVFNEDTAIMFSLQNIAIAYTFFDNEHYWATKEQYQGKGTSFYIIDPPGIKELKTKVKDAEIIVIYLKCDEDTRFNRMIKRAKDTSSIHKRLEHDRKAFRIIECNYVVNANNYLEEVLKDVKDIIGRNETENNTENVKEVKE